MKPDGTKPDIDEESEPFSGGEAEEGRATGEGGTANSGAEAAAEDDAEEKARKTWEALLRTAADFENYKKRAARDRIEAVKYANETLLEKLIPVLDTFDMALAAAQGAPESVEALKTGIKMIHQQLRGALQEVGLTEVDASGQPFDPNWHEALSQQESSEVPEGHVMQQLRKGYKLRDRLLRPASVVVAKKPAE